MQGNGSCGRTINVLETRENKIWRFHIWETASVPNWKCSVCSVCHCYAGERMTSVSLAVWSWAELITDSVSCSFTFSSLVLQSPPSVIIQPVCIGNVTCDKLFIIRCNWSCNPHHLAVSCHHGRYYACAFGWITYRCSIEIYILCWVAHMSAYNMFQPWTPLEAFWTLKN